MFKDYLSWAERHYGKQVTSYAFRAKRRDTDKDFMIHLGFSDGSSCAVSGFKDPYYKLFLSSRWFRESCYECPFASEGRVADLTLGDFWNAEKLPSGFGKGRRISVALVNTENGQRLMEIVQGKADLVESTIGIARAGNANLHRATRKYSGNVGYKEVGDKMWFFENEANEGIDTKKYLFNQLPLEIRRNIKKAAISLRNLRGGYRLK